jgi:HAD superfamily hydrolase (TIGR01484 family)
MEKYLNLMPLPIKLISTDFDGTLYKEFAKPSIPRELQALIAELQSSGVKWVINTGRDMPGLMEAMNDPEITVNPDFLVLVEREIHIRDGGRYQGFADWNAECLRSHSELFARVQADVPRLTEWVNERFRAQVFSDDFSPFCFVARDVAEAESIHEYLDDYCRSVPNLVVVRNDVYARLSHSAFNKGTALAELAKKLGIGAEQVFAVGDHLNDLPMLSKDYAHWLAAPANAIEQVKLAVRRQNGFVSSSSHGNGVAEALRFAFRR